VKYKLICISYRTCEIDDCLLFMPFHYQKYFTIPNIFKDIDKLFSQTKSLELNCIKMYFSMNPTYRNLSIVISDTNIYPSHVIKRSLKRYPKNCRTVVIHMQGLFKGGKGFHHSKRKGYSTIIFGF
jgi:hypothetical protein